MSEVKLTEWKKPSGEVVKLNGSPATIAAAESLGWERKKGPKPKDEK